MTADWPDDNPSAHRALAIYAQRVPLAHNASNIANGSSSIAGAGNANIVNAITVDQPSFQMLIGINLGVPGTTIPFGRLKFKWTDLASGFTVDPDWAVMTGAQSGLNFHYITGPARGDVLTVELDNLEPAQLLTYSFGMSAVSHVYEDFRFQEVGGLQPLILSRPAFQAQLGVLGSMNPSLGISGTTDRLALAWNGKAILSSHNGGGSAIVKVELLDPGVALGGSPILGTANSGIITTLDVSPSPPQTQEVSLPNGPVVIREINESTTATQQPTTTLVRAR